MPSRTSTKPDAGARQLGICPRLRNLGFNQKRGQNRIGNLEAVRAERFEVKGNGALHILERGFFRVALPNDHAGRAQRLNLKNQTQYFTATAHLLNHRHRRETQTGNPGRIEPSDVLTFVQGRQFALEFLEILQHDGWRFDLLELLVAIRADQQRKSPGTVFLPTVKFKAFPRVFGNVLRHRRIDHKIPG